jgi:hypothetical protein
MRRPGSVTISITMIETIFNEAPKMDAIRQLYLSEDHRHGSKKMFFRKISLPLQELIPAIAGKSALPGSARWLPPPPPARKSHRTLKIAIAAGILAAGVAQCSPDMERSPAPTP